MFASWTRSRSRSHGTNNADAMINSTANPKSSLHLAASEIENSDIRDIPSRAPIGTYNITAEHGPKRMRVLRILATGLRGGGPI